MKKFGKMFVQLRRQTHEIRSGFNDVIRDAERDIELEKIKELKSKLDSVKDGKVVETAIKDAVGVKDDSYHDSHYVDGDYKNTNKEDGYVNADELLAKAKNVTRKFYVPSLNRKKRPAQLVLVKARGCTSSSSSARTAGEGSESTKAVYDDNAHSSLDEEPKADKGSSKPQ